MNMGETEEQISYWDKTVNEFRAHIAEFTLNYNNLLAYQGELSNFAPEIQQEYQQLMGRGDTIRNTIETVTQKINEAANWISETFGIGSANQLGLAQFLPFAVVAGSITLITKWIKDAIELQTRFSELRRLQGEGMSADQAANVVSKTAGAGWFSNFKGALMPIIPIMVLGIAFYFGPQIKRLLR